MRGRFWSVAAQLGRASQVGIAIAKRHPRLALIGSAVLILVVPLVPELFFTIPPPVRKKAGLLLFILLVGACFVRLWQVRPGDRPNPSAEEESGWLWGLVPLVACGLLVFPFLREPGNLGTGDWDVFLEKYEAVRKTIVEWGQFPWWDPWSRGGFPLAGNPQCGVLGVGTPMVLAFGSSVGLRLAAIVCVWIATEGTRRLAGIWLKDPLAATLAGLIYGINGGVLVQVTAGYHLPMSYCACPWLLYHAAKLDRRPAEGIWLGAWLAFDVLNGIIYYSVYAVMIFAVVWLRGVRTRSGPARRRYLIHSILAVGTLLALAGWRLATTGLVYRDFPRHLSTSWAEGPWSVLSHLLVRPTATLLENETGIYYWDSTCYIGPVVLLLSVASLNRGWRWWHTLAATTGALAMGNVDWFYPSYWLGGAPLFSTMHMIGRWRIMAMLGVGLAAADELASWRRDGSKGRRWLALALVGLIAADLVGLGYAILPVPFRIATEPERFPGPPVRPVVQVAQGMAFPAVLRGYGMIAMPEPLLGYNQRADTARNWRGLPGYVGEAWTEAGPIEPKSWSPNRIEFEVRPDQLVTINQNPGSWWLVNGQPAFQDWRCAEILKVFEARADSTGRLVVEIRPKGLGIGLALQLVGLIVVVAILIGLRVARGARESPR